MDFLASASFQNPKAIMQNGMTRALPRKYLLQENIKVLNQGQKKNAL
jgi:hypothetical protein